MDLKDKSKIGANSFNIWHIKYTFSVSLHELLILHNGIKKCNVKISDGPNDMLHELLILHNDMYEFCDALVFKI